MERINFELSDDALLGLMNRDSIGRNREIVDLLMLLDEIDGGYSIFLDAAWGNGKTVFVKQAVFILQSLNPNLPLIKGVSEVLESSPELKEVELEKLYLPVYYNAWRNDSHDEPLATLIATIATEYDMDYRTGDGPTVAEVATGILDTACQLMFGGRIISDITGALSGSDYLVAFDEKRGLQEKVNELASVALTERADTMVLFIDELDRCSPDFALRLLEEVKFLFENEQVILVFSTDISQLSNVVSGSYGPSFNGRKYLERFYDRVIPLEEPSLTSYMSSKGVERDNHFFNMMTHDVANSFRFSLRTTNNYLQGLKRAEALSHNLPQFWEGAQWFSLAAIIPLLHAMRLETPDQFDVVAKHSDPSPIIGYLANSSVAKKLYSHAVKNSYFGEARYTVENSDLIEDICILAFSNTIRSERRSLALERSNDYDNLVKHIFDEYL